jgi:hypothetical protein
VIQEGGARVRPVRACRARHDLAKVVDTHGRDLRIERELAANFRGLTKRVPAETRQRRRAWIAESAAATASARAHKRRDENT